MGDLFYGRRAIHHGDRGGIQVHEAQEVLAYLLMEVAWASFHGIQRGGHGARRRDGCVSDADPVETNIDGNIDDDGQVRPGAVGGILASANIAPGHCIDIFRAFAAGDMTRAREMQHSIIPLNSAVTARWGVPALKAAMDHLGLYGGHVRRPLLPLPEPLRKQLFEMMEDDKLNLYREK